MATTGTFRIDFTDYDYFLITWEQEIKSSYGYSQLRYSVDLVSHKDHGTIQSVNNYTLKVGFGNGMIAHTVNLAIGANETRRLVDGALTNRLYHDDEGKYSFTINFETFLDIYWSDVKIGWVIAESDEESLEPIYREATIISMPSFNDEENPKISYRNPAGNTVKYLKAKLMIGETSFVSYKSIDKVKSGSYTFELTSTQRTILRRAMSDSKRITVTGYIQVTYNDDVVYETSYDTTCSIVNATPTLAPTVIVTDGESLDVTYNEDSIIIGVSDIEYAFNATALKNATIVSYLVECGGIKNTTAIGTMKDVYSPTFKFSVTDSRGNTASTEITKPFINYVPLTCVIEEEPPTFTSDTEVEKKYVITGNYFNESFGSFPNVINLQVKITEGQTTTDWTTVTPVFDGNTYQANIYYDADYKSNVKLEVQVSDNFMTVTNSYSGKTVPVFDWSEDDFNFNVPVTVNGVELDTIEDESMSSGTWKWRKWSSGLAECWCTKYFSHSSGFSAWGNGLFTTGPLSATNMTFPFEFTATPTVIASLSPDYTGGILMVPGSNSVPVSTKSTGTYEIARGTQVSGIIYFRINYYVRGMWK